MNPKTCLALIGTLIATSILVDSGSSGSDVHAAVGVPTVNSSSSVAVPERDVKQIGAAELVFRGGCFAPRLMGGQLVASMHGLGAGHRLAGGRAVRQITCARG
jgi:hypothetical protein